MIKGTGLMVCLIDSRNYPFIILRETKRNDIIFCLEDEEIESNGYSTPREYYHIIQKGEEASIRGKIVGKRCYMTDQAVDALQVEYGITINSRRVEYGLIKPYLKYKEVEINYRF